MNRCIELATAAFEAMQFRVALLHGYFELQNTRYVD